MEVEKLPEKLGIEILETYDPNDFSEGEVISTKVEITIGEKNE